MHKFLALLLHIGLFGPLILGVLDSSFLFLPFGNDLLLVILIARRHMGFAWYVPIAAAGSTIGVFLLDLVVREAGEEGLRKMMKPKRFDYLESQIKKDARIPIAVACIAPPPFPFTVVIAAVSAFQYPRKKELTIVFFARLVRFSLVGIAAILLGNDILKIARSTPFYWTMVAFIGMCVVGSIVSVIGWVKRGRAQSAARPA